jgi:hypothetical protein
MFGIVLVILCWLIHPAQAVRVDGTDTSVVPPVVVAGETVTVSTQSVCNDGVAVTITRRLTNGAITTLLDPIEYRAPTRPGCTEDPTLVVEIPIETVPGKYHLQVDITYQANPVRTVTVSTSSAEFQVIAHPEPKP